MIPKEMLKEYIEAGILKEYDLSANAREQHDLEMIEYTYTDKIYYHCIGDNEWIITTHKRHIPLTKKIKATREELLQYWKLRLEPTKLKEVKINE